jgi:adenylate kinase
MHLGLLGPPGSGKGTQAELLTLRLGLVHIASGDLFRDHLNRRTALGAQAKAFMDRGALVPDALTIALVRDRFLQPDTRSGTILDGFPRTVAQAVALDRMLDELGTAISGVLCIEVPDAILVSRIAGRLVCRTCQAPFHRDAHPFATCPQGTCHGEHLSRRDDDAEETVRLRLSTYHSRTEPLIDFFERRSLLARVAGEGSVEEVSAAAIRAAERFRAARPPT